jgi:hypothetical protein
MKNLREFFRDISWPIAWHAASNLLLCLGAIALFSYVATMHYYLIVPSLLFLVFGWFLLYKIEYGWRYRRTLGKES